MSVTEQRPPERAEDVSITEPIDVLVLGTLGGAGGVYQYIQEQRERLDDDVAISTYDLHAPGDGDGPLWLFQTLVLTAWALVCFPFRRRPDVVHVHSSYRFAFYRAAPYILFASLIWRRPVILHVHGSAFDEFVATESRLVAGLQSLVFDACARIVVLSPYWQEVLSMRADEDKLVLLPNAVDPSEYDPQFDADPPRIVFISTLIERKGVPTFVEAIEQLDQSRELFDGTGPDAYRVDIAGAGPLADRVELLSDDHDDVTYLGYVSEANKRELLSEGSIYVLPTHAENLPIAMLEGMAGGNAVVSTPVGGIPDVIGPDNGVLVEPGDPDALADALASLLATPGEVERMGRRNHDLIVEKYTWEAASAQLHQLYEDLARV